MNSGPSIVSVRELAASIKSGSSLGVPADYSGVPMQATRELIRQNVRDLSLYCLPSTTIQGDLLIGAGCVSTIETAAVSLGEFGCAPRFSQAVETGQVEIRDSTCPALHAQLQATEKSVPFMPLRGIIGSDIIKHRQDWKIISNPFGEGEEPIVLLPATKLDVTLFHAASADRRGNVWIGRRRELSTLVHASKRVLITVEKIVDTDYFETEENSAGALPAFYVEAIAEAPNGAWPCGLQDLYGVDADEMHRYAEMAATEAGFQSYLDMRVFGEDVLQASS